MTWLPTISRLSACLLVIAASDANAQQVASTGSESRAQFLARSFNKSKHVSKEKLGVLKEKYLVVRTTPAVRTNPADYSGSYEAEDLGFRLELRVNANGSVEGSGSEPLDQNAGVMRTFTLVGARIDGALLTGTQVFANGQRERVEGVFVNRTLIQRPNDPGTTEFGLGITGKSIRIAGGINVTRFFLRPKA